MVTATNDNGGSGGPFCILRHGRKSHTWGTLRQAAQHTMRDPAVAWLGENIDPALTPLNEALVGTGDVVEDVRVRLAAVGLEPKIGQVVARELLVSASHTYFAGPGQTGRDGDWDQDRLAAWKTETLAFLREEFGANLVTMTLHLDEAVPHAHVWVTTAVKVEKKGRGRPRKDGTKVAPVMGWTLNHDKVIGSGKDAFSERQDRYANAMAPLGLQRGQRHSKAHHQPIREFYAELPAKLAAAEAERHAARDLRLKAEQDAIRADILRQGAEHAIFVKAHGIEREFDQWRADTKAVAALRQNKGPEWGQYEKSLTAYATDLNQYGTLRDIIVRRADRHLRFLLEVGALTLGHTSIIRNPARLVSDGIAAWLRLVGGNDLVQRHRTVVGCMREIWAAVVDVAIEEPQRHRGRER